MEVELLTPEGYKYRGQADEVKLRGAQGMLTILPHHESLTAIAVPGPVSIKPARGKAPELLVIFGGLLEVRDNHVRVLADAAEHADDLVHGEVEAALARAKELRSLARDKHELHRAQELVDRHAVRLEVVHLRRRRRH